MTGWEEITSPTSVIGVLALIAFFIYLWRKDASNPAQTASYSVINSSVEYSGSVFDVAQEAMVMAKEAVTANYRCERKVTALVSYNRQLSAQLISAGVVPAPPPPELMDD